MRTRGALKRAFDAPLPWGSVLAYASWRADQADRCWKILVMSESVGVPLCPNCDRPMVRRVARKGPNAGRAFWGCKQFPGCRGTRPIEAPTHRVTPPSSGAREHVDRSLPVRGTRDDKPMHQSTLRAQYTSRSPVVRCHLCNRVQVAGKRCIGCEAPLPAPVAPRKVPSPLEVAPRKVPSPLEPNVEEPSTVAPSAPRIGALATNARIAMVVAVVLLICIGLMLVV